jgi:pimeloyl-ACP methyl ester carboxylesterase
MLFALAGCNYPGIGVRESSHTDLLAAWRASAFGETTLSQRTQQTLRQLSLAELYAREPHEAQAKLHGLAVNDPQADYLFALAEINYRLGQDAEHREDPAAVARYYLCAGYAYHYLFRARDHASDGQPADNAFDPRYRLACELYNGSLSKCIRAAQRAGRLDPRHDLHVPAPTGEFTMSVDHLGFAWTCEEFGPLLFASDFTVVGLVNHHRTYGLGVPLIGTRVAAAKPAPGHAFYPKQVSFPATAFFRFDCTLAELGACRAGKLELYNPLRQQSVEVNGKAVTLETDTTTPLAYFLSKTDMEGIDLKGFFRADRLRNRAGIYLFEPYQPGKIPVVLTHGLFSSPLTWARMYNDLLADPLVRDNYQFWFFLYPTGNSYLATAADLRQSLAALRADLDANHRDPALDDMVLLGHSMGGLVNKLLVLDSGDDFWHLVAREPLDQLKGSPQTLQELQRVFYFDRQSSIKRVVFLATPHRGSKLVEPTAYLFDRFLKLPRDLRDAAHDAARENPEVWPEAAKHPDKASLPTSLDMLTPGSPALEVLARHDAPAGVHFHSIIGVIHGQGTKSSDGFVPYSSSHIDGVDSEVLVPAGHSEVHDHPLAVLEIRRILRQHLEETRRRNNGNIILTGGSEDTQPGPGTAICPVIGGGQTR